jgi:hypothetical protein
MVIALLPACAAPRPLEVRDEGAPRGRAVARATAEAAAPSDTATASSAAVGSSGAEPHAPVSAEPSSSVALEAPGIPADASELTRADADFRAKRTGEAASLFINAFMAAKQSERTTAVKQSLDDAITIELERLAEQEPGWLSQIGLDGFCQRTTELRGLPASAANKTKIAAQAKRFCGKRARKDG